MAARKPSAIESTPTSTATTPAMPTAAATAAPLRSGMRPQVEERHGDDLRKPVDHAVPPQRLGDLQAHGLERRQDARHHAERRARGPRR